MQHKAGRKGRAGFFIHVLAYPFSRLASLPPNAVKSNLSDIPNPVLPGWKQALYRLAISTVENFPHHDSIGKGDILRALYVLLGKPKELMTMPGLATSYDELIEHRNLIVCSEGVNVHQLVAPIGGKEQTCESAMYENFDQKALPPKARKSFKILLSATKKCEQLTALLAEDIRNMAAAEGYKFQTG